MANRDDEARKAALRLLVVNKNPNTQAAISIIAVELAIVERMDVSKAVDAAAKAWDKYIQRGLKKNEKATWALEERKAEEFIRNLRRNHSDWRQILTRGTQ